MIFAYYSLDHSTFVRRKSVIPRTCNGIDPEFGRAIIVINMNVPRLVRFMTKKAYSLWSLAKHCRHFFDLLLASIMEIACSYALNESFGIFQQFHDGIEKPSAFGAVHHAVIATQAQRHSFTGIDRAIFGEYFFVHAT